MSSYVSKWTGKQIDDGIGATQGKGFDEVVGIIRRDENGYFFAAESYPAAENGTTLSLVTTGEKYIWNHMVPLAQKGVAHGVAELDASGHVPESQLPSYVDDVLEFNTFDDLPLSGESGKIYLILENNYTYRWSGSTYAKISESLSLGETSSTAYRGDRGKMAYDHAMAKGKQVASGLYKIRTNAEGHVDNVVDVVKKDITDLGIPAQDTTYEFVDKDVALAWGEKSTLATVGGVDIHVTMPANPDTDTTYTFTGGTNKFMVTPKNGTPQEVAVTPSIANNITGTGTSGSLVKFNGTNSIIDGPTLGSDTTKFLRNDGSWGVPVNTTYESKEAKSGGTDVSLVTTGEKYNWNKVSDIYDMIGADNGIAPLNENGIISYDYLPSLPITITDLLNTGDTIGKIAYNNNSYTIKIPEFIVSITPNYTEGYPIATINVADKNGIQQYVIRGPQVEVPITIINSKTEDGYVLAPGDDHPNMAWSTDIDGNPAWRPYGAVTSVGSGAGLLGGPITSRGTLKVDLYSYVNLSSTATTLTDTADRTYPVLLDSAGHLAVNIPWENTTYSSKAAASGGTEASLVTTGDKYNWNHKVGSASVTKVTNSGTKSGTITIDGESTDLYYDTNIYAGEKNGTSGADTTSGNTYINLIENGVFKTGIKIVPGLNMSVTSNADGSIIFDALSRMSKIDTQVTLKASQWSNESQTVTVRGVTTSNSVIVAPAPDSIDDYNESGIRGVSQAVDSLTFTCKDVPTTDLIVNILVIEEETL